MQAERGQSDIMQRAVHIWKKLLRTATQAESKQVQDVTTFMSVKGSGEEKEKSWEGGMEMEKPGGGSGDTPDGLRSCRASLFLGW